MDDSLFPWIYPASILIRFIHYFHCVLSLPSNLWLNSYFTISKNSSFVHFRKLHWICWIQCIVGTEYTWLLIEAWTRQNWSLFFCLVYKCLHRLIPNCLPKFIFHSLVFMFCCEGTLPCVEYACSCFCAFANVFLLSGVSLLLLTLT